MFYTINLHLFLLAKRGAIIHQSNKLKVCFAKAKEMRFSMYEYYIIITPYVDLTFIWDDSTSFDNPIKFTLKAGKTHTWYIPTFKEDYKVYFKYLEV